MRYTHVKAVILGAATFVAAHLVRLLAWQTWFHGSYDPWFLNSARAMAFTVAPLVVAGAIVSAADRRESIIRRANAAAGAKVGPRCSSEHLSPSSSKSRGTRRCSAR